jgi:hypothetical protein
VGICVGIVDGTCDGVTVGDSVDAVVHAGSLPSTVRTCIGANAALYENGTAAPSTLNTASRFC